MNELKCDNNGIISRLIISIVRVVSWSLIIWGLIFTLGLFADFITPIALSCFHFFINLLKFVVHSFLMILITVGVLFNGVLFSVFLPWEFKKFSESKDGVCNALGYFIKTFFVINLFEIFCLTIYYFVYPLDHLLFLFYSKCLLVIFIIMLGFAGIHPDKWYKY